MEEKAGATAFRPGEDGEDCDWQQAVKTLPTVEKFIKFYLLFLGDILSILACSVLLYTDDMKASQLSSFLCRRLSCHSAKIASLASSGGLSLLYSIKYCF